MNIAGQQLGVYSTLSSTATEKEYLDFLKQVLKVTADSRGDAQVVYPLLEKNTDKLDGVLAEILRRWGTNRLREAQADEAKSIAGDIVNFSILIEQFHLGDKASNMEIAITGYEVALTVYTQQAFPYEWARTQNNLAFAYFYRILGEPAENLEQAIACYQQALKVYTYDAFPSDWARTQSNLGNAYFYRILGEQAENLEQAIVYYQQSLKVDTFEAFPQNWARMQNNLASAYRNRIRGERAENLERAINYCQQDLKVCTFDAFPIEWAITQNNLGLAYSNRILGERAENLERAITYCQQALKVRTLYSFWWRCNSFWCRHPTHRETLRTTDKFQVPSSPLGVIFTLECFSYRNLWYAGVAGYSTTEEK